MNKPLEHMQHQFDIIKQQLSQFKGDKGKWFNHQDLFVSKSFHCQSEELADYTKELEKNIKLLSSITSVEHAEYLSQRVQDQFACFRNLLNAQKLNSKHQNHRKATFQRLQRVKQLSKQVNQSSQELYQELSKLQEYERRLIDMVAEKQQTLHQYKGQKHRQEYQQQVLVTQQRLGRCRQALSKVEEQIQKLDNRS